MVLWNEHMQLWHQVIASKYGVEGGGIWNQVEGLMAAAFGGVLEWAGIDSSSM